jgi:gluconate 5-dehydrogenase
MRNKMTTDDLKNMFDLSGKVAVVTGGSGGAGKAISIGLALWGADVVCTSRTMETLEDTAAKVKEIGSKVLPVSCDVTDADSVSAMMKQTIDTFGKVDILVTAAGIARRTEAENMSQEDFNPVMNANVNGTLLCCQAAAKEMIKAGQGGNMVTVGSIRGLHGHPAGYAAYASSKGAVHTMTKQMAIEWAKHQIRVNCIAPCIFWTPLTEPILSDKKMYDIFMQRIPIGRPAEPEDLVGAVLFLSTPASAMVTGHVLYVDGGTSAW